MSDSNYDSDDSEGSEEIPPENASSAPFLNRNLRYKLVHGSAISTRQQTHGSTTRTKLPVQEDTPSGSPTRKPPVTPNESSTRKPPVTPNGSSTRKPPVTPSGSPHKPPVTPSGSSHKPPVTPSGSSICRTEWKLYS